MILVWINFYLISIKGAVTVEKFSDILGFVVQYYQAKKFSKERKIKEDYLNTKVSSLSLMIFLANFSTNINLLKGGLIKKNKIN